MISALEVQRGVLVSRNKELEAQLHALTVALTDAHNHPLSQSQSPHSPASRFSHRPNTHSSTKSKQQQQQQQQPLRHSGVDDEDEEEDSDRGKRSSNNNNNRDTRERNNPHREGGGEGVEGVLEAEMTSATEMFSKLQAQRHRINQLELREDRWLKQEEEQETCMQHLRMRGEELKEEIENLRLELSNRPTMRQWNQKLRENQDLEDKLHDLVMMRGETAEIAAWRKHLSTNDRIKVDKRNYELGLWLLDSLPKTVTKEILQAVCRELDISDVSEIHNSIIKLKSVVTTVPRMEKFIAQVCTFLFQRDQVVLEMLLEEEDKEKRKLKKYGVGSGSGGSKGCRKSVVQPSMDDVMSVLKR